MKNLVFVELMCRNVSCVGQLCGWHGVSPCQVPSSPQALAASLTTQQTASRPPYLKPAPVLQFSMKQQIRRQRRMVRDPFPWPAPCAAPGGGVRKAAMLTQPPLAGWMDGNTTFGVCVDFGPKWFSVCSEEEQIMAWSIKLVTTRTA